MTLTCICGGKVELQEASYGEHSASELYRCTECEGLGNLYLSSDPYEADHRTGCLACRGAELRRMERVPAPGRG